MQVMIRYGISVLAVAVAALARWWIGPMVGSALPYPTFFCAILVAYWFGGLGPALVATAGGWVVADVLFIEPAGFLLGLTASPGRLVGGLGFLATGISICVVCDALARRAAPSQAVLDIPPHRTSSADRPGTGLRDYAIAALAVSAAIAIRISIPPSWGLPREMMFAALAVATAAVVGGLGPGLFAVVLAALGWPLIVFESEAMADAAPTNVPGYVASFLITGTAIALLGARGRQLQSRFLDAARQTERILSSISDAYQVLDDSHRLVYFNAAAQRILRAHGVDPADLNGLTLEQAFPTSQVDGGRTALLRAIEENVPIEVEVWHEPWRRWFLVRANPLPGGGTAMLYQDVTRRKRSDMLLAEQKRLLERIASGASTESCMLELTDAIHRLEPRMRAAVLVMGRERGVVERTFATQLDASFSAGLNGSSPDSWFTSAVSGGSSPLSARWPDVRNEVSWSDSWRELSGRHGLEACMWHAVQGQEGDVAAWCLLCSATANVEPEWAQDLAGLAVNLAGIVIERDRASGALLASESRFRAFVMASSDIVYRMSADWSEMWSIDGRGLLADSQLPNRDWVSNYIHPDDRDRVRQSVAAALGEGRIFELEHRVLRRDGTVGWTFSRAIPIHGGQGEITEWFGTASDVTRRKEAEQALRENETLLSAVLQQLPVGLGVVAPDGRWIVRNATMDEFVPEGIPSVIGERRASWRLIDAEGNTVQPVDWPGQRALRGEVVDPGVEAIHTDASGRERWLRVSAAPLRDDAGAIVGATVILQDIDAIKRAEQAARRSQGQLELLANTVPALISYVDLDCRYRMCNRTYMEWFGLPPEAMVGRTLEEVLGPDAWRQVEPHVRNALAGQVDTFETEARYSSGGTRWIHATYTPHRDEKGNVLGFVVFVADMTARKATEDAIRLSEARYRSLVSVLTDIPWTCDREGRFVVPQDAWERYTGQGWEAHKGHGWLNAVHPEDREAVAARWRTAIARSEPYIVEGRIWHADTGQYRYCSARATALQRPGGHDLEWVGTYTDVDDRIRADREMRAARERAEAAGRAKDDFIAALSHELRTPLTPVLLTATELLGDTSLAPEVRQQLGVMRDNIELETRLIDDLLDLTRIARGGLVIHPVVTDIHTLLAHTERILAHEIAERAPDLRFALEATASHVHGDPARLQQVFWNLLRNALKFTPPGGRITVRTRNPAPDLVEIAVEDSGIGINPASIERIFNAFDQGDLGPQHRFGGLGLGLAIAKAIVDLHGGTLQASSDGPGSGASFVVGLGVVGAESRSAAPARQRSQVGRRLRLLLVDDHEATRTILSRMLTRDGHVVFPAANLREARAVVATQRCDAVISDLGLPDGSGLELMQEIRTLHGWPGLALSGYGQEEDLARSREAGFSRHLTKPVDGARLRRALAEIVSDLAESSSAET